MSSVQHKRSDNASSPQDRVENQPIASAATPRTDLVALAFAVALPVLLVHLFVVKPTTTHLNQLRGQVARLENAMQELNEKTPTAGRSASLMASLTEQEQTLVRAEAALDRMADLQHRLSVGLDHVGRSVAKLDQLDQFRSQIDDQVMLLDEANSSLAELALLPEELQIAVDEANRAAPAVGQIERLRDQLSEANRLTTEVANRMDEVVAKQSNVLTATDQIAKANASLDSLVKLESRLNSPLIAAEIANERLSDLISLKESLLDETENLPEAFDTLELMVGLNADIRRASEVFGPMQKLIANLVMLEPSIARIASLVEPMMERDTVSRLGGTELRLVLQELRRRHSEAVEQLNEPDSLETQSDVATLPTEKETK